MPAFLAGLRTTAYRNAQDENGNKQKADWPRLAGMFRAAGYRGFLSLEYEGDDNAAIAVPPLLAELRRVTG